MGLDPGPSPQALLFSDIEGSTRLLTALGPDEYAVVLLRHRSIMRDAMLKQGGVEQGTEGDSFFITFDSAAAAVAAAVDAQRALDQAVSGGQALRVRIGIHVGEVQTTGEDLLGLSIHVAERVKSAAHGGQIVVSEAVRDLASQDFDPAIRLRNLGRHRLKDVADAIELFQVCHPELNATFPPLRTAGAPPGLPVYRSAFVGRAREVAVAGELVRQHRLVTLTGLGGCGKTRLAVDVARRMEEEFTDGVYFVDLSNVSYADGLANAVIAAIGLTPVNVVDARELTDSAVRHLANRRCLVVVDNCEHVLDAVAALVDELQQACLSLSVLATSREPLMLDGEQRWAVPPMALPTEGEHDSEAVNLFVARARAAQSDFSLTPANAQTVASLCRRLDGLPLAIEFAASRVREFSPRQILDKLDDRFRLLTGGRQRVQRQQTLQATLDWSHELLSAEEQALLRRLAVFATSFASASAAAVCHAPPLDPVRTEDVLGSLASKSLIEPLFDRDIVVYRLLETVRAYAGERLASAGDAVETRDAHSDWVVATLEAVPWASLLVLEPRDLPIDVSEVRAALSWAVTQDRPMQVARLFARATSLWFSTDMVDERRRWTSVLEVVGSDLPPDERALLLLSQVRDARSERRLSGTLATADLAVAVARDADPVILASALGDRSLLRVIAAGLTRDSQLAADAESDIDEALELVVGLDIHAARILNTQGQNRMMLGDIEGAAASLEAAAERFAEAGVSVFRAFALVGLAATLHVLGHTERAAGLADEILEMLPPNTLDMGAAGTIAAVIGGQRPVEATQLLTETIDTVIGSPRPGVVEEWLTGAAGVLVCLGLPVVAGRLLSWVRSVTLDRGLPNRNPSSYVIYRHYVAAVRSALPPDVAREVRAEGSTLDQETAVVIALDALVAASPPGEARG